MSAITRRAFVQAGLRGAAGLTGSALLGAGCGSDPDLQGVSADARALHSESVVLDLHVDTILWRRLFGYDLGRNHRNRFPLHPFGWHMDLPRAAAGGLDAAVMGLVINPDEVRSELMLPLRTLARWEDGRGIEQTLATLQLLADTEADNPENFAIVKSGSEMSAALREGRLIGIPALEGSQGIGADVANLTRAHEHGLRMLGLVHFQATEAGYPMTVPEFDGQGLTPYGHELVAESERLGVVVDIAHLNAAGVVDALAAMTRPCVVSHTACKAVHDNPRNLDDDQLRAVGERGGVIGIAVGRSFIGGGGVDGVLDHVEHAARHAGHEAVAIGSDWDGFIIPESGLEDVRSLPSLTAGLLARGWAHDDIRRFLGGNALRVLTEVCG